MQSKISKELYSYYSFLYGIMPTTIQLKKTTLQRLKYFKVYSKESYDEIINKLLDTIEEGDLTKDAINDIQKALSEMKSGKGELIGDVAQELGVNL